MSLLNRLGFARAKQPAPSPRPSQLVGGNSQDHAERSQGRSRRELLRVILRDALNRHGIPANWIEAEILMSTSRNGERGIHWRLVVRHADPRLLKHAVAFQQALLKRLTTFEPGAAAWLTGLSWQFDFADDSPCPPMPPPASWLEPQPEPFADFEHSGSGEGTAVAAPVVVHSAAAPGQRHADARADLNSLLAARDADFKRHSHGAASGEDATQPMFLSTEPAKL